MDPVLGLSLAGLLAALTPKAQRLYADSARIVQDAMLDSGKSGKALAIDGAWDEPSLSRQIRQCGLNFAGLYTALRTDRRFALAFLRRLCQALRIAPGELIGQHDADDALAARVARIERALAARDIVA